MAQKVPITTEEDSVMAKQHIDGRVGHGDDTVGNSEGK